MGKAGPSLRFARCGINESKGQESGVLSCLFFFVVRTFVCFGP